MDPSGINNFEDQWRKAFSESSETPPPSIWEGIEARLDEDNDKGLILPLWRTPKVWYAAASIVALMIVGASLWFSGSDKPADNAIAAQKQEVRQSAEQKVSTETTDSKLAQAPTEQSQREGENNASEPVTNSSSATSAQSNRANEPAISAGNSGREFAARSKSANTNSAGPKTEIETDNSADRIRSGKSEELNAPDNALVANQTSKEQTISAEELASLPYNDLDVHVQKRYVFFRTEPKSEEPVKLPAYKEYWAGVGLMPASFNPDVRLKEAPIGFSKQMDSNVKSVSGSSEAGVSYALQTQGGMRLSKHWTVELGLSYLQGNSTYQGGGYLLNATNSRSANVLENALAGVAPATSSFSSDKNYFANSGAIYVDVNKRVSNNYQYLQMPVQAGFTLNPDKRLSYSVLGGMMANFFLSNDLEAASGEIITTNASDEVYRSMNWAATTGLRFNYRLSSKWKASLTGSYQKAITSGFRSNQSLDAHPYLYGVAWGVRYSF